MQVKVISTSQVEITYPAGTSANQKPPHLAVELVAEGTKIVCKTELSTVVPRFLAVFDKAITITQVNPAKLHVFQACDFLCYWHMQWCLKALMFTSNLLVQLFMVSAHV